jgi:hypothetical protein
VLLVCPAMLPVELALDGFDDAVLELEGLVEAAPLALGVLLAEDCVLLVCPAMLPEALALDGADEAFSELAGLVEALEAELLASPVVALLLGAVVVEALALGEADCEALAPDAAGAVPLDCCEALALEFTLDPDASLELFGEALALDAGAEDMPELGELLGELLAFAGPLLLLAELPAFGSTFNWS